MAGKGLEFNGTGDSCCCSRCEDGDEGKSSLFTMCSWAALLDRVNRRRISLRVNARIRKGWLADANANKNAKCSLDVRPSNIGVLPLEMDGPECRRRFDFITRPGTLSNDA